MEVYPTNITDAGVNSAQTAAAAGSGELKREDFMLLLMTQLKHQDPLEPMDSESMLNQFTQLNSLEELQTINRSISELSSAENLTEASGLIGRQVTVATQAGVTVTGVVSSVSRNASQVELWIDGTAYPLSALSSVEQVEV